MYAEEEVPQYKNNECLPKEYLDKVKNYFDDSQITNINMIQNMLKQVTQQMVGEYGGPSPNYVPDAQYDLQSLLGFGGNGGYSQNTENMTNYRASFPDPSFKRMGQSDFTNDFDYT